MPTHSVERYAVFGNPIAHTKSPRIHTLFAEQTNENIEYSAFLAQPEEFAEDVLLFFLSDGKGCNITLPFKESAWELADSLTEQAQRAKAVNTLVLQQDGTLLGANTDGIGLVRDLQQNHNIPLQGKRILLLGAGGAVRGIIQPLLENTPSELVIANRTVAKAQALAAEFSELGTLQGGGFDSIQGEFDLIINGTSASLQGELPPLPETCLTPNGYTYDMMYNLTQATAFVEWGIQHGASKALDGLGMLVEQAAEAYYLWRRIRPNTALVLDTLRTA